MTLCEIILMERPQWRAEPSERAVLNSYCLAGNQ
jgi:hypothetical protein